MQTVSRLIKQFIPSNYKISLEIDGTNRDFYGNISITGITPNDTQSIILHSKDLKINSIKIDGIDTTFSLDDNDELIIDGKDIKSGEHDIFIDYSGKITDGMHGIYPCYYEHDGVKKELIATQFESHHAREVFPCVDEPAAKATFDLTLITEKTTVLGNMPIKNQVENDSGLTTIFETTPVMSSYLLAWVVGELQKKTAHTKSGVEVNIWATLAQPADSLDFALDIATRAIDFFDAYFDTPYPLSKCDHVALPDFSSGAMENWGLITYREIALLADPKTTSVSDKRYIATVISHELSHQWFGNLVTMEWWNDLWLNESFATLVEYVAVDALEPDWHVWLDFASYESTVALKRDSLAGVQSVQTDVNHPDEIMSLFDGAIVYAKGARLLQMLQNYIGEQAFKTGLKNYFKTYAYKNTIADDLWASLSEASGKDIASFMQRWISQPGFPVLHADKENGQISLSQNRLSCGGEISDTLWPIPLNSNYPELPILFETESATFDINSSSVLRFNIGSHAHFITHYSPNLLVEIINELKSGKLSPIDRLQLLNEQSILAGSGIISSAGLIPLLRNYGNETVEAVWDIISLAIGELKKFVEDDIEAEGKLRQLAANLAEKQFDRLGWDAKPAEPETDTKLRSIIVGLMLYSEKQEIIDEAINIFKTKKLDEINPELRGMIISAAVKFETDLEAIKTLLEAYEKTCSSNLQQDICGGLTSVRDEKMIGYLLDIVKDTTVIRPQDSIRWIAYLIRSRYARSQTWQWMRDNWQWIEKICKGDKSYDDYPKIAASSLRTNTQLDEYREFFTPKLSDPALSRVIEIGINEITNRISTIERDKEAVRKALLNL